MRFGLWLSLTAQNSAPSRCERVMPLISDTSGSRISAVITGSAAAAGTPARIRTSAGRRIGSVRRGAADTGDLDVAEQVHARVEAGRVAVVDDERDVRGVVARQRRVEALPVVADPRLSPRVRHEHVGAAR